MSPQLIILGVWGHAAAAFLFAALAVWQAHRRTRWDKVQLCIALALAVTSVWALASAYSGGASTGAALAESARNAAWLAFLFLLAGSAEGSNQPRTVKAIYLVLALLLIGQVGVDIVLAQLPDETVSGLALDYGSYMPRMIFAVGALLLVHNVYTISAPSARWGISLPMAALAAMWTYDLNLYTIAYLTHVLAQELIGLRGVAIMTLAPLFGMAMVRNRTWKISLSRSVAFQTMSLSVIGAYLIVMFMLANAIEYIGGDYVALAQVTLIFGMCVIALLVIPSGGFRSWLRVQIAKHFFKHRYDYRAEWIRFTETVGKPGPDAMPFDQRVIRAVADICQCGAGLLLTTDRDGRLLLRARWNWADLEVPNEPMGEELKRLASSGYIIELESVRQGQDKICPHAIVPDWLIGCSEAWAIVPLLHFDRLVGVAILSAPPVARGLDWEDLDMFRVAGRQVASYLAEAGGQQALMEARQFDSLNRRFAFIIHDIKNLVSQLSLLARNAERHADNPEFRADMVETLQISVGKMNDLLARLSQHNKGRPQPIQSMALASSVEAVVAGRRLTHPIELDLTVAPLVQADPARVETILAHIIQNAIDASASDAPVTVRAGIEGGFATIDVIDQGCGMDETFLRENLFKPFSSNKDGGFGIGAFEALTLAQSMGGRIAVESRTDKGSRFTLYLPLATHIPDKRMQEKAA